MTYRRSGITALHPATLAATWFGAGLLPKAPGTWGSLAALPFAWALASMGGTSVLAAATIVCFALGWWASAVYVRRTGVDDPGEVVIDEVAGIWLTLVFSPPDLLSYGLGFVLFRIFDIWKPWPVSWADRDIGGGLGVMLDDVLAGIYALAGLTLIRMVLS